MADYYFRLPNDLELSPTQKNAINDINAISLSGGPGTGKIVVSLYRHLFYYSKENPRRRFLMTYTISLATEEDLIEIIRYGTKIFTDPTMKKNKGAKKVTPYVYVSAFDNIISAMKRYRFFDRFGFYLPKTGKPKGKQTKLANYEELIFDLHLMDCVNEETKQILTGYKPTSELTKILKNNFNIILQRNVLLLIVTFDL